MLYTEWLIRFESEARKAVKSLFEKCKKNQSDPNDLLLVLIHGYYNTSLHNTIYKQTLSPYVFGRGLEGYTHRTQYEFFHFYRQNYLTNNSRDDYIKFHKKENNNWDEYYHLNIQLEILVYLKFWESDFILKQLYNLCNCLLHGNPYDWHKDMKSSGKKDLIENQIINSCKIRAPKFYAYLATTYFRQIRNAAAHSQFYLLGDKLHFTNYDPVNDHNIKTLLISEWEEIFHRTILLYNFFIENIKQHEEEYIEDAKDKHFGKKVRITSKQGFEKYEWLRYFTEKSKWIWYKTWEKHYMKTFYIV